jgi:hypothetical protein
VRAVSNGACLFRPIVHPFAFRKKKSGRGPLVPAGLMHFKVNEDGSLAISLVWRRFAPTIGHVHAYGCRLAAGRNEEARLDGTYGDDTRQIYCGSYQLTAESVHQMVSSYSSDLSAVEIFHEIENGEIAHVNVRFVLNPAKDPHAVRTIIVNALVRTLKGPLLHCCCCDRDLEDHPNRNVAPALGGEYVDQRSCIERTFHLLLYHVACVWFWREIGLPPDARQIISRVGRGFGPPGAVVLAVLYASIVSRASASVRKTCSLRHSSRSLLLNDSTKAFCTGLPGSM